MVEPFDAIFAERRRPDAVRGHRHAGWFAVATVCFGAFMGQLDASIVTLAFPAMQRDFHQPLASVQWVSLCYLIALVALLPLAGRIADRAGRKLMYLHGFLLFTVASVACGFAPDLGWLIAFRVLQAVGAAMLQANSVALVVTSVPREKIRTALGVQSAAQALGLAAGPVIGGLLVAALDWRWVFWIKLPIGIVGVVAGWFLLPRTRDRAPLKGLDLLGLVSSIAETLRPRSVWIGLIGALCGYLVLFGPLTLLPQVLGSHGRIGLVLSCLPLGFGLAAVLAPRLRATGLSVRAASVLGAGIGAAATGAVMLTLSEPVLLAVTLLLAGVGLGVFIPANNTTIMTAIPHRLAATGGGLVNMARSLGTAFGVATVTSCLSLGADTGALLALACLAAAGVVGALSGLLVRSGH
jgi:MFS family permease